MIYLEASLVARVAAESFEFDPTRTVVPPLDGLNLPELRSAMLAVDTELRAGIEQEAFELPPVLNSAERKRHFDFPVAILQIAFFPCVSACSSGVFNLLNRAEWC
jgi:hypothetical protein